jgi:hypothetical protein
MKLGNERGRVANSTLSRRRRTKGGASGAANSLSPLAGEIAKLGPAKQSLAKLERGSPPSVKRLALTPLCGTGDIGDRSIREHG